MEWIDLKKMLPPQGKDVLVCYKYGDDMQAIQICDRICANGHWRDSDGHVFSIKGTYWMPLPGFPVSFFEDKKEETITGKEILQDILASPEFEKFWKNLGEFMRVSVCEHFLGETKVGGE